MADQFFENYKHPLWRAKRAEIIELAGGACEHCGVTGVTLQVHHSFYERGVMPWEYPNESLTCLCEACHDDADWLRKAINRLLGSVVGQEWKVYSMLKRMAYKPWDNDNQENNTIDANRVDAFVYGNFSRMRGPAR